MPLVLSSDSICRPRESRTGFAGRAKRNKPRRTLRLLPPVQEQSRRSIAKVLRLLWCASDLNRPIRSVGNVQNTEINSLAAICPQRRMLRSNFRRSRSPERLAHRQVRPNKGRLRPLPSAAREDRHHNPESAATVRASTPQSKHALRKTCLFYLSNAKLLQVTRDGLP